jgi:dephospho-CoA kinase
MFVIGITGGIGVGKTTVTNILSKMGVDVLLADNLAHEVYPYGSDSWNQIVEYFGVGILDTDNQINRKKLANCVFTDSNALKKLNDIVHPPLRNMIDSILRDKAENQVQIVLLEAAILLFAGWQDIVDEIWLVQTPRELVENRLSKIGKFNSKDLGNRLNAQMHYFDNKELADIIIDNSSTKEALELKISKLWESRILKKGGL